MGVRKAQELWRFQTSFLLLLSPTFLLLIAQAAILRRLVNPPPLSRRVLFLLMVIIIENDSHQRCLSCNTQAVKIMAGKYQMAGRAANTFCKFVKRFSFTAKRILRRTVFTVSLKMLIPIIFNKINAHYGHVMRFYRRRVNLHKKATIDYFLAHSSAIRMKILISSQLCHGKPNSIM